MFQVDFYEFPLEPLVCIKIEPDEFETSETGQDPECSSFKHDESSSSSSVNQFSIDVKSETLDKENDFAQKFKKFAQVVEGSSSDDATKKTRLRMKRIKENLFICDYCGQIGRSHSEISQHMKLNHLNFFCDLCPSSFSSNAKKDLIRHIRLKHLNLGTIFCTNCDFLTSYSRNLSNHMKLHQPKKKCSECSKFVANISQHHKTHQIVCCFYCQRPMSKLYLKRHVERCHELGRTFFCDICSESFPLKENLRRHLFLLHLNEHVYQCSLCDFVSLYQSTFYYHKLKKHGASTPRKKAVLKIKQYNCGKCSESFNRHEGLKR